MRWGFGLRNVSKMSRYTFMLIYTKVYITPN
nr:MAG TPA: hypothetical protein [Caudoviricetes sp.]